MADAWKEVIIVVFLIILFIVAVFGIMGLRRNRAAAPTLEVNIEDVTYTDQEKIQVTGKVDKGSNLKVNEENVVVDADGNYSFEQKLNDGENKIKLEAEKSGKVTTVEKTIVRQTAAEKDVNGTTTPSLDSNPANGDLNESGPAENVMGVLGLTAIFLAYRYYLKSKKLKLTY